MNKTLVLRTAVLIREKFPGGSGFCIIEILKSFFLFCVVITHMGTGKWVL